MSAEQAVKNPLAREIVDAVQLLGLKTVFEPGKTHPRDWANPGRVRVLVKEGGRARSAKVKNSMLFIPYTHPKLPCLHGVFGYLLEGLNAPADTLMVQNTTSTP